MTNPPSRTFPQLDPAKLAEQVSRIVSPERSCEEKTRKLLQLSVDLVSGVGGVFFRAKDGALQLQNTISSSADDPLSAEVLGACAAHAKRGVLEGRAIITDLPMLPSVSVLSCPVAGIDGLSDSCLTVLVALGDTPKEPFLIILQLLAAVFSRSCESDAINEAGSGVTERFFIFLTRRERIKDLPDFCDALREWLNCTTVAVGTGIRGRSAQLQSVSDVVKVDVKTSLSRLFIKVMQDSLQHDNSSAWPLLHTQPQTEESLLVKELVQATGMQQGLSLVLPGVSAKSTLLVFLWREDTHCEKEAEDLMRAAPLLGMMMQNLGRKGGEPVSGRVGTPWKKKIAAAIGLFLCAWFIFYPARFTLHPGCSVVPVQIRYVVARFDGILAKVFAEPGDRVTKDEPLAILDGRELALELRSLKADSDKSLKLRDNYFAAGNIAAAQMALLEYRRQEERANLLRIRQQELSLNSPVSGIVLSGDLKQAEGGPVTKGQPLFEVAPLDTILIELAVADADISHVQKGSPVTVRFDAFPGRSWQGKVNRIAPKSTLLQGENIFTVSFQLVNDETLLQPGMRGRASVGCGRRSLLFIYFHKPWYALVRLWNSLF